MKIRVLISQPSWTYKLHVKQDAHGRYYVFLSEKSGEKVKGSSFIGGFESIDWIVLNAVQLYAQLTARPHTSETKTPTTTITL